MVFFTKSKVFLTFCLSFVAGILFASYFKISVLLLFVLLIFSIIAISIFWRNKKIVIAGFAIIFLVFGVYRHQTFLNFSQNAKNHNISGQNAIIQGMISDEPDIRIKDTRYVIQTETAGKVLITMPHYPEYKYGDLLELEGKLVKPEKFDSFDYQGYLAKDDIFFIMYSPKARLMESGKGNFVYSKIFEIKNKFKEKIKAVLPEPESSLLRGLLLGERSGMGDDLKNAFAVTGTSHIVAVSGFNVTIIAIIILELFLAAGFSRSQSFWISLAAIVLFIIMVGSPASAVRAGIMGILLLLAVRSGRLNAAFSAVSFAATLMLWLNPRILRFDAGFQLSFLAVIGIVWLYPVLDGYFSSKKKSNGDGKKFNILSEIRSAFLITISAQIMALPVLLYNFGNFSLIAPLANILILPFIPLAMALGFLAGLIGFLWTGLAKIIGYFTWLVLAYQIRTIESLASFSWASVKINDPNIVFYAIYYVIIALIIFANKKKKCQQI